MPAPSADLQKLDQLDPWIELYEVDLTPLGGQIYRFTPSLGIDLTCQFGGKSYLTMVMTTSGWDFTSTGPPPKPSISISNVHKWLLAEVIGYGDLVGAKVTRIRTFAKYLDGGDAADSTAYVGPDVYWIERKTSHDNVAITWSLCSIIDRMGMMLPRRQVLKDETRLTPGGFPGVSRSRIQ